jgi:threonylcarbamoyladenosine tRNA methylthiotransferase MtaB
MNQFKKVAFYTLGCKLNFSETSTIARDFEEGGYARVDFYESPDIYVINTCSVTENADKKCRQLVKKALKHNPDAFVAIIGCYAQLKPTQIAEIPGVDIILGANEKFNLLQHVEQLDKSAETKIFNEVIKNTKAFIPSYSFGDRTRTFLKIQDGCDYFCSFCTIPLARGTSRSNDVAETIKIAEEVAATEVKEVVLTGVNIGDFGAGTDENFFDLVKALDQVSGIERFRISSIEPNLLSDEIIAYVGQAEKFVPHFHIPLQSGSNKILKAMRRRYEKELYVDRVAHIKKLMPNCCIGVDVIVGFPGETEDDFIETYDFIKDLDVSYLHVFTYSERANTTAVRMDGVVPKAQRAQRSKMLHILSEKKKRHFYEENIGATGNVLLEGEDHDGYMFGFTENYVKVKLPYDEAHVNKMFKVQYTEIAPDGIMRASILEEIPTAAKAVTA